VRKKKLGFLVELSQYYLPANLKLGRGVICRSKLFSYYKVAMALIKKYSKRRTFAKKGKSIRKKSYSKNKSLVALIKKVSLKSCETKHTHSINENGQLYHNVPIINLNHLKSTQSVGDEDTGTENFACRVGDEVVLRGGVKMRPPKYYDGLYEIDNPEDFNRIKLERVAQAEKFSDDNTLARRIVKEKVHLAKMRMLVRDLE